MDFASALAAEFSVRPDYVRNIIELIDAGNTIPFIARYRKEKTGSMDDQLLRQLAERLEYLRGLEHRRQEVAAAIEAQGKLTDELRGQIEEAATLARLEDLYRPFRQKRRTRASAARERGLEPLARWIREGDDRQEPLAAAAAFVDPEKGVESPEAALAGAQDIIAEELSDDARLRGALREMIFSQAFLVSRAAGEEDSVYAQYYDFRQPVSALAGHRVLAIDRGEREKFLKVTLEMEEERPLALLRRAAGPADGLRAALAAEAAADSWKRLIFPSLERELRAALTAKADEGAIRVFGENLRGLLMAPPIRGKVVLGMDPGYRMGCKLAVVDPTGRVLETAVIYPTEPFRRTEQAKATMRRLIDTHKVEVLAIGNGTAGRETELFAAELLREYGGRVSYMVVSESGASVYSASPLAAEEFPDFDVNLRSAVSIARRLQDPLAELIKIDPKAVGVGQYQHDMPPARLDEALGGVVEDCVNTVGVELNTASVSLLGYVAGISRTVAKNIVARREAEGPYRSRRELLRVPKLGPKAFEQCAGFLRISGGDEPLDASAVHPESYAAARGLLARCGFGEEAIGTPALGALEERMQALGKADLAAALGIGLPTLEDIAAELRRPGRDLRDTLPPPLLRTDVMRIEDLKPGMELTGTVRNVVDFGAFVDIGVHQDGLVHISQLSDRFVRRAGDLVSVGDLVKVRVLEVDVAKKRISLTMKSNPADGSGAPAGRTRDAGGQGRKKAAGRRGTGSR